MQPRDVRQALSLVRCECAAATLSEAQEHCQLNAEGPVLALAG